MQLNFISKENWAGFPTKNRKNKHRKFYSWKLSRFIKNLLESEVMIDIFPSSSENIGIQLIKTAIIASVNRGNPFDFDYIPAETDFLENSSMENNNKYLLLIFKAEEWIVEKFIFTERAYFDIYADLKTGYTELQ